MADFKEMLNQITQFINRSEVAGFTIGVTGGSIEKRIRKSDHFFKGRLDYVPLAAGLERITAFGLEKALQDALRRHLRYDKGDKRYSASGRGKTFSVYLAWRRSSWRPEDNPKSLAANRERLAVIEQRYGSTAKVTPHTSDRSFRAIRDRQPPCFVLAVGKERIHFHFSNCRWLWNTAGSSKENPLTGGGRHKYDSTSLMALMRTAEGAGLSDELADKDGWEICDCIRKAAAV
jgi:hypothetical protein